MDETRPEAPELELTAATATADDALQLGPADLPEQPQQLGDAFAMKLGEAARVESYKPAKPAKAVTAAANQSVIAALMGLPIAKKPAEPPAPELPTQSAIVSALTAGLAPIVKAAPADAEPEAAPAAETAVAEVAVEPAADQVYVFDAGIEVIHADDLPPIEDPAITEQAFDMTDGATADVRGTGFQPASSPGATEEHGLETRGTVMAEPAEAVVPIVAVSRPVVAIEVKSAPVHQPLFARPAAPEKPAAPVRPAEPPRRAVPVAPVWPATAQPAAVPVPEPKPRPAAPSVAATAPTLDYAGAATQSGSTGAWWTIPLTFVGIAIVACAVLIPAADENRRDNYELAKIEQDVVYFERQSEVNQDFLKRVNTDPNLAERLAMRQLHQARQGVKLAPLAGKPDAFGSSPYAMTRLDPPPPLPAYQPMPGKLSEWFLGGKNPQQMASLGLIIAGAGVLLGGLRFKRVRPMLPAAAA